LIIGKWEIFFVFGSPFFVFVHVCGVSQFSLWIPILNMTWMAISITTEVHFLQYYKFWNMRPVAN
jgi:hypothetical protein